MYRDYEKELKKIKLINNAIALFQWATIVGAILCIVSCIMNGLIDGKDEVFIFLAIASVIFFSLMFIGLIIGNIIGGKLDRKEGEIKRAMKR